MTLLRYYADSGATILKRESNDMTVRDVLEHTLRKRCLRFGPEYVLEPKARPGEALEPCAKLVDLEGGGSMKALEFRLIRKHSASNFTLSLQPLMWYFSRSPRIQ